MDNTLTLHGANPENLYRCFGIAMPERIIDFSTNTNIISWPQVSINLEQLASHYPDPDCSQLREIIAERENISESQILFTNGTNEAIFLLASLFAENTAILQPAYSEYARAFTNLHNAFSLDEAVRFQHIIIINPNNPTGRYMHNLSHIISANPGRIFIIDEAYIDFLINFSCGGHSHAIPQNCTQKTPYAQETISHERLCDYENVIILRSLTKIFHLSGARICYVIASEKIISALRRLQPSWSVNAIAQELALCFLRDDSFLERTRAFYRRHTPDFMQALRAAGFEVMNSDVHYFLVRVADDVRTIKNLLKEGIVVRHTRNFAGLDGKYIRIATRTPEENNALVAALAEAVK